MREIKEEVGICLTDDSNILEIKPILIYESCYPLLNPFSQILVVFYKLKLNLNRNQIILNIQLNEIEAYAWINITTLLKIPFCVPNIDYKDSINESFEFLGYEYTYSENEFKEKIFTDYDFFIRESREYLPYGHFLAIRHLN